MLSRNNLLYILAGLIFTITILHAVAMAFALYWHFWWYDLVLHFLGGVFSALFAVWFCFFSGYTSLSIPTPANLFRFAVLGALLIGAGWELFERVLGHSWSPEGYYLDTGIDIVMDTLGGFIAYALFLKPGSRTAKEDTMGKAAAA